MLFVVRSLFVGFLGFVGRVFCVVVLGVICLDVIERISFGGKWWVNVISFEVVGYGGESSQRFMVGRLTEHLGETDVVGVGRGV